MPFDREQWSQISSLLEEARGKKRLRQSDVSEKSGYADKSYRNAINGKGVSDSTLLAFFETLELDWPPDFSGDRDGNLRYGGYSRQSMEPYIGSYEVYRRDFDDIGVIIKCNSTISWNKKLKCLTFHEHRISGHSHYGVIGYSQLIGLIHLHSMTAGAFRLATMSKFSVDENIMRGCLMSQTSKTQFYQPCVTPIIYKKISNKFEENQKPNVTTITKMDNNYHNLNTELNNVSNVWVNSKL